jgi:diguanylate cyclase (GGDEF)-like protein
MDRLRLALARARRGGGHIAVLYLDIDRFKQINDTLGHAAGDALLRGFALRLRGCVRASDTVARLGGDEFVVLLDDVKERSNALAIAEKILDAVRAPFDADGQDMLVTASIGIADGGAGDGEDAMLKRADAALYDAKAAGRNAFRIAA